MHILLTDRLVCPRCGPPYGLILLADRIVERRVLDGSLGCPNCRDRYPLIGGFADLRAPPRTPLEEPGEERPWRDAGGADADEAVRLGALLGVARGPAQLALVGSLARYASALAERLEEVEVVAISEEGVGREERAGVSRLVARPGLPFFDGVLRGVALHGEEDDARLEEAARVVSSGSRIVVTGAGDDVVARLAAAGLTVLVDEAGVVVGER